MNNNYAITLTSNINNSTQYYIVFKLQGREYAINIKNVLEVINLPEIEIPAKAPSSIIGMFNYNGMMIKTIDLCPLLGFQTQEFSINNQLIITIINDACFAIHTEKIENILQLEQEKIQTMPFEMKSSILKEVYKAEKNSINIIDINALNNIINNQEDTSEINYNALFPLDEKSQQILKIRANQIKINQEVFSFPFNLNSVNQYILFTLDNQNYYIDLKWVKEFTSTKRLNITNLPYTQDFIKGLVNVKGDFIVVVDLKRFLNNDTDKNQKESSKLIVIEGKNFNIAFLVDEIKFIKNLKKIQCVKNHSNNSKYIYSEFMEENELYSILNIEKIIGDERLYININ